MRYLLIPALSLALAACEAAGGPGAGPSPTPPPSPSPTPSPTPTPSPAPTFGFAAPFSFESDIGIEATQFVRSDPSTPLLVTDLRDVRFLDANRRVGISYRASPRSARFSIGTRSFDYGAPSSSSDERLVFGDANQSLQIGPLPSATTHLAPVLQSGPGTPGVIIGAGRPIVLALVGNRSTEQAAIDTARAYEATPSIVSEDLFAKPAVLSVQTRSNGVRLTLILARTVNGNEQRVGEIELIGTHDRQTNRISGNITDGANGAVGSFVGALYGPSREMAGLIFEFRRPQSGNVRYIGYLIARPQ